MVIIALTGVAHSRDLNWQNYQIGERAVGMGGAFVSMVGDPASTYYNPAGLAGLYKQGISLSASVYQLLLENYTGIIDLDAGGGDSITADMGSNTFATFPSSMVYVLPLDKNEGADAFHHVLAFSVLIPHYDKMKAEIDKPLGDFAFEMKGTFLTEDMTYWAGPSYAVSIGGSLRLGLSLFVLAHLAENQSKLGLKVGTDDPVLGPTNWYNSSTFDRSGLSITMLAQAGIQYMVTDNLCLGLTVRSPTFGTFYSSVSILMFNNSYFEDELGNPLVTLDEPGWVDRIETEEVEMNYQLPLMVAVGASYSVPDSFAVALDVSLHLGQGAYALFDGDPVYPQDPMGADIIDDQRVLDPYEERQTGLVVNANLGAEFSFTKEYMGRVGVFTNFTTVDQDFYDNQYNRPDAVVLPALTRIGVTLGFGMIGEKSTTSFGINYVVGFGETFGLSELFDPLQAGEKIDVTTHTITAVLAGSADL
jgi:long-subunit fatty acid transport protein